KNWEAGVLPLNYSRSVDQNRIIHGACASMFSPSVFEVPAFLGTNPEWQRLMRDAEIFRRLASVATISRVVCEVNHGPCDLHRRGRQTGGAVFRRDQHGSVAEILRERAWVQNEALVDTRSGRWTRRPQS